MSRFLPCQPLYYISIFNILSKKPITPITMAFAKKMLVGKIP